MNDVEKLIQKRSKLDEEIKNAKKAGQRKTEVLKMLEKAKILHLPDEILKAGFATIFKENSPSA